MSDETKPSRPEPKLQPMKIVQVAESPVTQPVSVPGLTDDKGKKLVFGKREHELKKANEAKTKLVPKQSAYHMPIKTDQQILEANNKVIDDLDRNAKLGRNEEEQSPQYDVSWLKEVGGRHVSIAWLQTPVSVSGFISSESTFSAQKIRGLTMSWTGTELLVNIKNTNGDLEGFIPAANVKMGKFE